MNSPPMTDTTHTALTTEALEALLAQVTQGECR